MTKSMGGTPGCRGVTEFGGIITGTALPFFRFIINTIMIAIMMKIGIRMMRIISVKLRKIVGS